MVGRYAAYRRGDDTIPPEVVDRVMVGVCAAVWLIWLGASVVAVVALVDLGRGFHNAVHNAVQNSAAHNSAVHDSAAHNSHTNWVLYSVIIASAVVIAGAIPVLLRARRLSSREPRADRLTRSGAGPAGSSAEWSGAEVDRVWLRGTVTLAGAMGVALIGAEVATYLMAVGRDNPAWIIYGVAGAVIATMPLIEWLYVRQLRALAV